MIITTIKGRKKHVTSSFFKDISLMRSSEADTNYRSMYKERKRTDGFDIEKLKQTYAIQKLILFKKGCQELSEFASKLGPHEIENVVTDYMGSDYEEYTGVITPDDWSRPENSKIVYKTSGDL